MYLCNWWRLTKCRVHERKIKLAFSGQRVAAERHGDLLHRDLEAGRRERLDEEEPSKQKKKHRHSRGEFYSSKGLDPASNTTRSNREKSAHTAVRVSGVDSAFALSCSGEHLSGFAYKRLGPG